MVERRKTESFLVQMHLTYSTNEFQLYMLLLGKQAEAKQTCICVRNAVKYFLLRVYNKARMPADFLSGKFLGSRISTYFTMGEYLGYSMYVMFALTYGIPIEW